jgi:hypothetical protein
VETAELADLKVDSERLFEAIDHKRRHARMPRKQLSALLGITPGRYTQWSVGGGIGADAALRAVTWLNADFRAFAKQDETA